MGAETVFVGVPTFQRAEGLRRTLECLTAQTYRDLQIVVADNASQGEQTAAVAREFAQRDARVSYVRHASSLGAIENFRYLLGSAKTEYFMWAADDDEWSPQFVERCVEALRRTGAGSAMTGFETLFRASGRRVAAQLPSFAAPQDVVGNLLAFMRRPTPSIIYGLHRRAALDFFLRPEKLFDYFDCYLIMHLIAHDGVALVPESLYVAGVDTAEYQVKTQEASWGSGLRFAPFFHAAWNVIRGVDTGLAAKTRLRWGLCLLVARLFVVSEARALIGKLKS